MSRASAASTQAKLEDALLDRSLELATLKARLEHTETRLASVEQQQRPLTQAARSLDRVLESAASVARENAAAHLASQLGAHRPQGQAAALEGLGLSSTSLRGAASHLA